jgi:hypothetical protein
VEHVVCTCVLPAVVHTAALGFWCPCVQDLFVASDSFLPDSVTLWWYQFDVCHHAFRPAVSVQQSLSWPGRSLMLPGTFREGDATPSE